MRKIAGLFGGLRALLGGDSIKNARENPQNAFLGYAIIDIRVDALYHAACAVRAIPPTAGQRAAGKAGFAA